LLVSTSKQPSVTSKQPSTLACYQVWPPNPVPQQQHFAAHPSAQQYHPGVPNSIAQQQKAHQHHYAFLLDLQCQANAQQSIQRHATNSTSMPRMQQMAQHHHQRTLPRPNTPAVEAEASAQPMDKTPETAERTAERVENRRRYDDHMVRYARQQNERKDKEAAQALKDQQTASGPRSHAPNMLGQAPPFPHTTTPQVALPVPEPSQSSRPPGSAQNTAPAATNEPVKARTRPTFWPVPVSLMSSTADWDNKYSDDDSKEDVKPPISPPLSPLPAQNSGKTKRKLSIVDLTGDTPVPRSKRARKVESKEHDVDCGCKPDVRMKIARLL
jgi:hypothetical protein